MEERKKRYSLLDFLRGAAIIDMVLFHFLYDIYVLGAVNPAWPFLPQVMFWQRWGMWLFVLVAGMSCALMGEGARWRYGLQLNALGLVISLATLLFIPDEQIICGVLNFFGCALWLTALIENGGRRLLTKLGNFGVFLCILGAALFYRLSDKVALFGNTLWQWPSWLYNDVFLLLGFHSVDFVSADYVPLLPHIFVYWLGFYLLTWLREKAAGILSFGNWHFLTLPGRHTLLIYLVHQPVLLALLLLAGVL